MPTVPRLQALSMVGNARAGAQAETVQEPLEPYIYIYLLSPTVPKPQANSCMVRNHASVQLGKLTAKLAAVTRKFHYVSVTRKFHYKRFAVTGKFHPRNTTFNKLIGVCAHDFFSGSAVDFWSRGAVHGLFGLQPFGGIDVRRSNQAQTHPNSNVTQCF